MSIVSQLPMQFPVLRVNMFHIERFESSVKLCNMSQKFFDHGGFKKETFFLDSHGKKFPIESVIKKRRSRHIAYWFAPAPVFIVDISVGMSTQLSLEEIKKLIIDLVIENHWYRQGGESEKEFHRAFEGFQSIHQVLDNISFYGKWQG